MDDSEMVFDMLGFGCTSCAYAIERTGLRIDGVDSVRVSLADHVIRVVHHGDGMAIAGQLRELAGRLGHDIRLREPA